MSKELEGIGELLQKSFAEKIQTYKLAVSATLGAVIQMLPVFWSKGIFLKLSFTPALLYTVCYAFW